MAGPSTSTACWRPRWWHPGTSQGDPAGAGIHRAARWGREAGLREQAAKRWLAAHAQRYAALDPVYLGDDLFSRQPICQAVLDTGGHFIFVCKPSSHPLIQEYLTGAELAVLRADGQAWQAALRPPLSLARRMCRCATARDALIVNWFEIEIINATRRDHLSQQLRHRSAGRSRHRRRTCRLRPGPVEDRERDVQCSEEQGLQP